VGLEPVAIAARSGGEVWVGEQSLGERLDRRRELDPPRHADAPEGDGTRDIVPTGLFGDRQRLRHGVVLRPDRLPIATGKAAPWSYTLDEPFQGCSRCAAARSKVSVTGAVPRPGRVPQAGGGADARFFTPRAAVRKDSRVACPSAPSDSPCACFTTKRLFTRQRSLSGDSSNL
jgi:hypothetical protein